MVLPIRACAVAPRGDQPAADRNSEPGAQGHDFGQIYDTHVDFAWRTLRRFGVPEASLDDAVQDVFIVAYNKIGTFEGRSSIKTWVFGIARRVARDYRPAGRSVSVVGDRLEALADTVLSAQKPTLEQLDAARLLERLLERLHPEKREAFVLVEVEQMTIVEAAEALGVNANTVYSRLRAARSEIEQAACRLNAHDSWRQGCPS